VIFMPTSAVGRLVSVRMDMLVQPADNFEDRA
jgi:hypothetical protein